MDEMDDSLGQLEYYASGLATAVRNLTHQIRSSHIEAGRAPRAISDSQHTEEVKQARRSVLSQITAIQTLLCSPTDVLQQLAYQSQLLACLQWLGENQILACIPRVGHLPIKNIADLAGVSEPLLSRVVRFVTTRGFLLEDPPGHIAHTALSDQFFSNPLLLDAAMFMAESAAPAALKMARLSEDSEPSAFNLALGITTPFKTLCDERPRLRRQFSAYLYYASGLHMGVDTFTATLTQLDWNNITNSLVVEVGAHSDTTARRLACLYPSLRFVVQLLDHSFAATMSDQTSWLSRVSPPLEPGGGTSSLETDVIAPRITMAKRTLGGARQTVTDAGAYIVHLPTCSPDIALAELRAHGEILRAGNRVMLIPTSHFLTEPGSTANRRAEGVARSRDLSLLQLANAKEMELTELLEMIDSVKVNNGKLIVTRKLLTADNVIVALVVKYQMTEP